MQLDENFKMQVIEPPIYKEFNWDMVLIMKALEYLRQVLPHYLKGLPDGVDYFLIAYEDKFGNPYPAIGLGCSDEEKFKKIPGFIDLYDQVEIILRDELPIEKIRKALKPIESISWEKLQEIEHYPNK